jgi:hypothetical protein
MKSGELTERSLARLAGISQPHLHNVMKGTRVLSPATADAVVRNLRLTMRDLLREQESALATGAGAQPYREVPIAAGRLGPGCPFPDFQQIAGYLPFCAAELDDVAHPVAVRLAADPQVPPVFRAGDIVLLEPLPWSGQPPQPGCYYAIEEAGSGSLRAWNASPAGTVRAKAIWIGRHLQAPPDPPVL